MKTIKDWFMGKTRGRKSRATVSLSLSRLSICCDFCRFFGTGHSSVWLGAVPATEPLNSITLLTLPSHCEVKEIMQHLAALSTPRSHCWQYGFAIFPFLSARDQMESSDEKVEMKNLVIQSLWTITKLGPWLCKILARPLNEVQVNLLSKILM